MIVGKGVCGGARRAAAASNGNRSNLWNAGALARFLLFLPSLEVIVIDIVLRYACAHRRATDPPRYSELTERQSYQPRSPDPVRQFPLSNKGFFTPKNRVFSPRACISLLGDAAFIVPRLIGWLPFRRRGRQFPAFRPAICALEKPCAGRSMRCEVETGEHVTRHKVHASLQSPPGLAHGGGEFPPIGWTPTPPWL